MWSKIFVLIIGIGLLSILILMIRFIGYADDIDKEELKQREERFKFKAQSTHMKAKSDYLFWFLQVCGRGTWRVIFG